MNTEEIIIKRTLSFAVITIYVKQLGSDYSILIQGGEKPHIGSTVMAIPRPSLTGDKTISATSSVINVTGHKDEELCRFLAETVAKKTMGTVVCTGGFHMDNITSRQIKEVMDAVKEIALEIVHDMRSLESR